MHFGDAPENECLIEDRTKVPAVNFGDAPENECLIEDRTKVPAVNFGDAPENERLIEDRTKVPAVHFGHEFLLTIGQEVDLDVRIGGAHHVLHGQVAGLNYLSDKNERY